MRSALDIFILFTWICLSMRVLPSSWIWIWCLRAQQIPQMKKWLWYWKLCPKAAEQRDRNISPWWHYGTDIQAAFLFLLCKNKWKQTLSCVHHSYFNFYVVNYTLNLIQYLPQCRRTMFFKRSFLLWILLGHSKPLPLFQI